MSKAYSPPTSLLSIGQPLEPDELEKTLLRFPGPCGFQQLAHDALLQLAPADNPYLYLFENRYDAVHLGIQTFGSLAVFQPKRFQPVRLLDTEILRALGLPEDQRHILLGLNQPVTPQDYFWIPPELHLEIADWTGFATAAAILQVFGSGYESRLLELKRNVLRYMEEVDLLISKGHSLDQAWYTYPEAERSRLLQQKSLKPNWTARI